MQGWVKPSEYDTWGMIRVKHQGDFQQRRRDWKRSKSPRQKTSCWPLCLCKMLVASWGATSEMHNLLSACNTTTTISIRLKEEFKFPAAIIQPQQKPRYSSAVRYSFCNSVTCHVTALVELNVHKWRITMHYWSKSCNMVYSWTSTKRETVTTTSEWPLTFMGIVH